MYINQTLTELEQDDENILFTQIWLEVNVMFVFEYYLYGNLERKVYKRLFEVNKKVSECAFVLHSIKAIIYLKFIGIRLYVIWKCFMVSRDFLDKTHSSFVKAARHEGIGKF